MKFPNNPDYERALMGCILIAPEIHDEAFDRVNPSDFYSERHQIIFKAMSDLHAGKNPVDIVTVCSVPEIENRAWFSYVSELADIMGTSANWDHYAKELRQLATARQAIQAGQAMINALTTPGPIEEAIDQAQQIIMGIHADNRHGVQYAAGELANESMSRYKDLSENGRGSGITTGYHDMDTLLGGGFRPVFGIIAARPGQGKTALAINMAYHQARYGYGVGLVSLEMGRAEIWDRLVAIKAGINTVRLANGHLGADHWQGIVEANGVLSRVKLFIDDSPGGQTVADVRRICRKLVKRGCQIIYIDQLSKLRGKGKGLYETNTYVVNELSPLCKELGVPIILLAQINREAVAAANKKPSLNHLKATGALEEDADIVMFIHREFEYTRNEEKKREAIIDIAKHRGGPCGDISLRWVGEYTRFEEER